METKLDKLIELLKSMTDEEIVGATSNTTDAPCVKLGDLCTTYLHEKDIVCITKDRYEELLKYETYYNDFS